MASEKSAYTLTDHGTFLAHSGDLDLGIVREGDPILENPYHVILVNPDKHPNVRAAAAERFANWLLSPETQKAIGAFGVDRFKQPLFLPRADVPAEPSLRTPPGTAPGR